MKSDHLITFAAVAGIAFIFGLHVAKQRAQKATAAASQPAAQGATSASMDWLLSWGNGSTPE